MSQLALQYFLYVMDYYCSIFNYPLLIFLISIAVMCVSIIALVAEKYYFTDSSLWGKCLNEISCDVSS